MSELDWRSPEAYRKMRTADTPDFAWESLRRNHDYQKEYRVLQINRLPLIATGEFRQQWGLSFRS